MLQRLLAICGTNDLSKEEFKERILSATKLQPLIDQIITHTESEDTVNGLEWPIEKIREILTRIKSDGSGQYKKELFKLIFETIPRLLDFYIEGLPILPIILKIKTLSRLIAPSHIEQLKTHTFIFDSASSIRKEFIAALEAIIERTASDMNLKSFADSLMDIGIAHFHPFYQMPHITQRLITTKLEEIERSLSDKKKGLKELSKFAAKNKTNKDLELDLIKTSTKLKSMREEKARIIKLFKLPSLSIQETGWFKIASFVVRRKSFATWAIEKAIKIGRSIETDYTSSEQPTSTEIREELRQFEQNLPSNNPLDSSREELKTMEKCQVIALRKPVSLPQEKTMKHSIIQILKFYNYIFENPKIVI